MRKLIREYILKEFKRTDSSENSVDLDYYSEEEISPSNVINLWCTKSYFAMQDMEIKKIGFVWFRDKESMLNEINIQDVSIYSSPLKPVINRVDSLTKRNIDPMVQQDLELIKRNFSHPPNHKVTIVIHDHTNRSSQFPSIIVPNINDPNFTIGYFFKEIPTIIRI